VPQIPSNPPIVLPIIEEKENILLSQSEGIKPPTVDPPNTPIQIRVFVDME